MTSTSISRRELAELLSVTPRAVAEMELRGMPVDKSGRRPRYDAPACVAWYVAAKVGEALARVVTPELDAARARKTAAEARLAELELAALEGRTLTVEEATREVEAYLTRLRAVLLAFPTRNAHRLVGKKSVPEVSAVLDEAVRDLMGALVDAGRAGEEAA